MLANGWVLGKDFGHLKHGLVQTSHATQSKTDDIVLAAINRASLGAMSAEQGYVTDLARAGTRDDLHRPAADELRRGDGARRQAEIGDRAVPAQAGEPRRRAAERMRAFMEKVRTVYRQLQRKAAAAVREPMRQREMGYAR